MASHSSRAESEPTEHASPGASQVRRKRQLDLVKCGRCRVDKQKCLPIRRVWPTRCSRCIEKGLACSEGKRVERHSKYRSTLSPQLSNESTSSNQMQDLEDRLRARHILLTHHINLTQALRRLETLKEDTTEPFFDHRSTTVKIDESGVLVLQSVYERLEQMMLQITNGLLTLDAPIPHLPGILLPGLLAQGLTTDSLAKKCPICEPSDQEKILEALERTEDVYSEFLARQYRLVKHFDADHEKDLDHVLLDHELDRYKNLSVSVKKDAHDALKRLDMLEAAGMSMQVERYHPDVVGSHLFECGEELWDCLGRSTLHSWLDNMSVTPDQAFLEQLRAGGLPTGKTINEKDILGRSPLHIACQRGWKEGVEVLLKLGADPNPTTIYGSSPLHYAAASGFADICEVLLGHTGFADIKRDCQGELPMGYAKKNEHTKAVRAFQIWYLPRRNISFQAPPNPFDNGQIPGFPDFGNTFHDFGFTTIEPLDSAAQAFEGAGYTTQTPGDLIIDSRLETTSPLLQPLSRTTAVNPILRSYIDTSWSAKT